MASEKTFQIPKSDCGQFMAGIIDGDKVDEMIADGAPAHGIVIWYKSPALVRAALQAVSDAHWPDHQ